MTASELRGRLQAIEEEWPGRELNLIVASHDGKAALGVIVRSGALVQRSSDGDEMGVGVGMQVIMIPIPEVE